MKILAVASGGGHWEELLRLRPAFEDHEVIYLSTKPEFANTVSGHAFIHIEDFSHWQKSRVMPAAVNLYRIIKKLRPNWIITTGAAPGVISLLVGKLLGCKTIWVESMCHADKISVSGKMAAPFCDRAYTQWEHLSSSKYFYAGNIMI